MSLRLLLIIAFLGSLSSCKEPMDNFQISSPDASIILDIKLIDHKLSYSVKQDGQEKLGHSTLEIFENGKVTILGAKETESDSTWKPVWGQHSSIRDHFRELQLDIDIDGVAGKLLARVYDEGLGFRIVLNEGEKPKEGNFKLTYKLPDGSNYYFPKGETEPVGPVNYNGLQEVLKQGNGKKPKISVPLLVELKDKSYLSLLESDLFASTGIGSMHLGGTDQTDIVSSDNKVSLTNEEWKSPWRVILLGKSAGDLVVNTIPVNLATPSQLENTDWIKPGKTLWDWRVHGYTAPDGFIYGINTESYFRFIDFAAEKDIRYFLIDDSWYKHATEGHFELSEKLDLQKVIDYAAQKGVELILYYDRKHGEYGDEKLFHYYNSLGMKGIKYGFMGNDVEFTKSAIQKSAESHLLIDFHDGPVPFTGISRTFPNAITREYCHAQQDSRRAFTPESFIKMALINAITGPLDMNNGNFDLTGINSGLRQKGPKETNSYVSTVVSEAARTVVIFSGLVCIPDAPEAYAAKANLFEFIQKLPVGKWDESHVLHSNISEYISTARRHGEEWFVGSVYSQKGGTLDISLDFLEEGKQYEVTLYEDTAETHGKTNPEAYQIRTQNAKKGDLIKAVMAPGGGHCMWIKPVE